MKTWLSILSLLIFSNAIHASVLLSEFKGWQLQMSGFVEADYTHDTSPSFLESVGNNPIAGPDTPRGGSSPDRKQFSVRNSRFAFSVVPSAETIFNPKAYIELDLLGSRLSYPLGGSDDTFYGNPSLRIRHLYFRAEEGGWQFLTGQYWTLFGWVPTYVLTTASVAPGPGILYQRTPQFTMILTWSTSDHTQLQFGLSFEHASQKAGGVPNLDAGVKYSCTCAMSGLASATSDIKTEPFSVALSGTLRKFATGSTLALDDKLRKLNAQALAINALVPLLPSEDGKEAANTLTWTGEFTFGTGYGDAFPGWSGNLPLFPYDGATQDTYMSKGQGGYNSDGYFQLFHLQSFSTQLQYHFPGSHKYFITTGHSELSASNVQGLGPIPVGLVAYDKVDMNFVNLFHDFSQQVRAAVEYAKFTTHYLNDVKLSDERYQISGYFRF